MKIIITLIVIFLSLHCKSQTAHLRIDSCGMLNKNQLDSLQSGSTYGDFFNWRGSGNISIGDDDLKGKMILTSGGDGNKRYYFHSVRFSLPDNWKVHDVYLDTLVKEVAKRKKK